MGDLHPSSEPKSSLRKRELVDVLLFTRSIFEIPFSISNTGRATLRLSFATVGREDIAEALGRFGCALSIGPETALGLFATRG